MEPYFDLGNYTRGTSTASTGAQTWFDRGLLWSYAFHHEEAIRCFERAVEHDPGFALAHWGIAYASGPNYNKQWEAFDPVDLAASLARACDEVAAARACVDRAAPVERALVEALESRYQAGDPSPTSSRGTLTTPRRCVTSIARIPTSSTSRRSSPTR
jgi:tetratricopeptide (TPR) repeat protein